jgi:hypothetical protein
MAQEWRVLARAAIHARALERLGLVCAVQRRRFPVGENPTRLIAPAGGNSGTESKRGGQVKPPSCVNKIELLERRLDLLEFIAIAEALGLSAAEALAVIRANLPHIVSL